MRVNLIPATDEKAWDAVVSQAAHNFYQTARYHQLWADRGDPWLAVCADEDRFVAWPFLLCRIDACPGLESVKCVDVNSVYGYPGPVTRNCDPQDDFTAPAFRAVFNLWRDIGAVSAFSRFSPLLENHRWLEMLEHQGAGFAAAADGEPPYVTPCLRLLGHTVSIDLLLPEQQTMALYRRTTRHEIAKNRRSGLTLVADPEWKHLCDFVALLFETMDRNHAAPEFYLSVEFFRRFHQLFQRELFLLTVQLGSSILSAGIFVEYGGVVHALYVANNRSAAKMAPAKTLFDGAANWARQRGNRILHLGGGRGARDDDSLFFFKSGFSSKRHPFYVGSWVLDAARYRELTYLATSYAWQAGLPTNDGFFPAYRSHMQIAHGTDRDGISACPGTNAAAHQEA